MRVILLALSLLGLMAASEPASADITYPWCAQYGGSGGAGGGRNCGFWTYQQHGRLVGQRRLLRSQRHVPRPAAGHDFSARRI